MTSFENDKKFLFCLAALGEAFGQEVSDMKIKVYAKALEDMPLADIERACMELIRSRTTATFPKVAEIREAATGKVEDKAQIAANKLEKALDLYNGFRSVVFDDPVMHMAIEEMGGWIAINKLVDNGEWKFRRGEFAKTYAACLRNPVIYPPVLVGESQQANEERGFTLEWYKERGKKFPEPVYIGDIKTCKQIAAGSEGQKQIGMEAAK